MSQRSALSAAASATALVSEPPRPKVRDAVVGREPLEARHDGDLAVHHPRLQRLDGRRR